MCTHLAAESDVDVIVDVILLGGSDDGRPRDLADWVWLDGARERSVGANGGRNVGRWTQDGRDVCTRVSNAQNIA